MPHLGLPAFGFREFGNSQIQGKECVHDKQGAFVDRGVLVGHFAGGLDHEFPLQGGKPPDTGCALASAQVFAFLAYAGNRIGGGVALLNEKVVKAAEYAEQRLQGGLGEGVFTAAADIGSPPGIGDAATFLVDKAGDGAAANPVRRRIAGEIHVVFEIFPSDALE